MTLQELIDLSMSPILGITVALLDPADQLFGVAMRLIKVIIS